MFVAGNKQLVSSTSLTRITLILTFSQWEKKLILNSPAASHNSLSPLERAGVRAARAQARRSV